MSDDSPTNKIKRIIRETIGRDEPRESVHIFDLGSGVRVEFKGPETAVQDPTISSVTIKKGVDTAVVDAYIPDEVPSHLVVEMGDGTYRIELENGKNEYAIRDGNEVSDDD